MSEEITPREFASREGCSAAQVRRAINEGILKLSSDGLLDASLVGSAWSDSDETAQEAAERIIATAPANARWSKAEAEQVKENYLAKTRQLEYEQKAGLVAPIEVIGKIIADEYAKVRSRLLAIPSEQAPRIQRLKTTAEVEAALREVITEALEELVQDRV